MTYQQDLKHRPFLVGLTGTFGSGKTTVARIFRRWGAEVINSDQLVHEGLRRDKKVLRKIVSAFGRSVLNGSGHIDREKLAHIVFSNRQKKRRLERIVHPYVFASIRKALKRIRRGVVLIEMPLLFETGFHRNVHRTIVVAAAKRLVIKRLSEKQGVKKEDIERRIAAQMPLSRKKKLCDFVINNTNGLANTTRQARLIWAQIIKEKEVNQHDPKT